MEVVKVMVGMVEDATLGEVKVEPIEDMVVVVVSGVDGVVGQ